MIYSQDDIIELGGLDDHENSNVPDSEQDIKPRHHKAKTHGQNGNGSHGILPDNNTGPPEALTEGSEDESDYDESEDGDKDYSEWNIRKCSAATLDIVATVFADELLPILLPLLKECLFAAEWERKEAGVLALGAIADGCYEGMEPHLTTLLPYLLESLRHPKVKSQGGKKSKHQQQITDP